MNNNPQRNRSKALFLIGILGIFIGGLSKKYIVWPDCSKDKQELTQLFKTKIFFHKININR